MMKSGIKSISGNRSVSNSQESNHAKKSITTLSNSLKSKSGLSSNNMIYSIKQNRINGNSNSNKKLNN